MEHHFVDVQPGYILAFGKSIDARPHSHPLWQICIPYEHAFLNDIRQDSGFVIPPNVEHKVNMASGWIILAEPESKLGACIESIADTKFSLLSNSLANKLELFEILNNQALEEHLSSAHTSRTLHPKLMLLMKRLDNCFSDSCVKPESWRAREVAESIALSESRFLHLVKEQLGIAWRPYLLWRRLLCAIKVVLEGKNATQAAYIAGFSDSAHLSRTIKKTFGMNLTELVASFSKNS